MKRLIAIAFLMMAAKTGARAQSGIIFADSDSCKKQEIPVTKHKDNYLELSVGSHLGVNPHGGDVNAQYMFELGRMLIGAGVCQDFLYGSPTEEGPRPAVRPGLCATFGHTLADKDFYFGLKTFFAPMKTEDKSDPYYKIMIFTDYILIGRSNVYIQLNVGMEKAGDVPINPFIGVGAAWKTYREK